jgi:SAM-dependent methyltransferase
MQDLVEVSDEVTPKRSDIVCLSTPLAQPSQHSYFDLVRLDHFWVTRRFEVLRRIAGSVLNKNDAFCEIGCGTGILQRQLETLAGIPVDGIEVSYEALEHNISQEGTLYCYDIFEQDPSLRQKYDTLFLFDVLEHIDDDAAFLKAAMFHVKPGGRVVINVPARQELYSGYDKAAGHCRRYNRADFLGLLSNAGLKLENYTYWGLPLYPVLITRKLMIDWLSGSEAYQAGFRPANRWVNTIMQWVSRLEWLPQRKMGISLLGTAVNEATDVIA